MNVYTPVIISSACEWCTSKQDFLRAFSCIKASQYWFVPCMGEEKQDASVKDRLMLCRLMTKPHGNSQLQALFGRELKNSRMAGIVLYEFVMFWRNCQVGVGENTDEDEINKIKTGRGGKMPALSGTLQVLRNNSTKSYKRHSKQQISIVAGITPKYFYRLSIGNKDTSLCLKMLFQVWFHLDDQFSHILNESFAWHFHNHKPPERQAITVNCSHAATIRLSNCGKCAGKKQKTKPLQKEHINPIPKKVPV